jgi:3-phytase
MTSDSMTGRPAVGSRGGFRRRPLDPSSLRHACIGLAASLLCGACASNPASAANADRLLVEESSLQLLRGDQPLDSIEARKPIEAFATDGALIIWQEDDDTGRLLFRSAVAGDAKVRSIPVGLEAEALCLARIEEDLFDLFLVDGDGALLHYWLDTGPAPALQPVRTMAVNPDAVACAVDAEYVYVLNPPVGIVAYARNPEADPVMELVYAPPPAGAGTVEPVAFRVEPGAGTEWLTVWDRNDRAWRIDPASPAVASPAAASRFSVPLRNPEPERPPSNVSIAVPSAETTPVPSAGDAADDPAILVSDTGTAWIVGTNKRLGIHVYDLDGRERQRIERGRTNNVDALQLSAEEFLLAASNRTEVTLDFYRADLGADRFEFAGALPLDLDDPYGVCMGRLRDGRIIVNVGGTDGRNQVWTVEPRDLASHLLREFEFESQTEGCVYDATGHRLYIGEEAAGIWSVDPESGERSLFATAAQGILVPDVEGMDIYRRDGRAWLVVSSQGDDSFVIYPLPHVDTVEAAHRSASPAAPPVKLRIGANHRAGIDGVSETDGLAVSHRALPGYSKGILVVQDGRNRAPAAPQNFKIIDWGEIEKLLPAP